MAFVALRAGLNAIQAVWAGVLVGQTYLLRQDFDRGLADIVRVRLGAKAEEAA